VKLAGARGHYLLLWLAPSAGGPHRLMAVGRVREFCLTSMCCHLDGCVASRRGSLAAAALGLVEGALSGEAAFAWARTRGRGRVLAAGRGGLVTRTCDIDHGPCRAAGGLACTRAFASSLAALAAPSCVRDWREPLRPPGSLAAFGRLLSPPYPRPDLPMTTMSSRGYWPASRPPRPLGPLSACERGDGSGRRNELLSARWPPPSLGCSAC
jgi:hypothetical protein